ncbi:MAG: hypothetical protein JW839_17095 [Candidatus Lokiarchaeota archaeon]|nr:hypothetical protein [Candidatus Lokiarchaeota archaeon]
MSDGERDPGQDQDEIPDLAEFMLDYIKAHEAYRDAVTKRVHMWEQSTSAVFEVVKQVMQVSENNAAIVMRSLEGINNFLSQLVGLDRAGLARVLESTPVPAFTAKLERVDISAYRARLEVGETDGRPAGLETHGMKKFLKYMA